MMFDDNVIDDVKRIFELNLYEARLWLALLSRGVSTAGELSEISAVPRSRTYDVLESLRAKRLVVVKKETRPVRYFAVDPKEALDLVKENFHLKMEEQAKVIDQLKSGEAVGKLFSLHSAGAKLVEKHEKVGLLRDRRRIGHQIDSLLRGAKKAIKIMATPEELDYLLKNHNATLKEASDRGVKIKITGPFGDSHRTLVKRAEQFGTVHSVERISARVIMKDDEEMVFAFFPSGDVHELYDTALWVHSTYFVEAMGKMFDAVWNK